MIRIVTVQFDYDVSNMYYDLRDVLHYSLRKHVRTDDVEIVDIRLDEPYQRERARGIISNTDKLFRWQQEVEDSEDGDCVMLLDCDMMVLKDPCDIFEKDFDVAYTERENSGFPINGGAIFVKVNQRSKKFFRLFLDINNRMYDDIVFHTFWRKRYAGINQSAFGYLIDEEGYEKEVKKHDAKLLSVPCSKWNVCQDWDKSLKNARIIHVKGQLRKSVFFSDTVPPHIQETVALWRQYKAELLEEQSS